MKTYNKDEIMIRYKNIINDYLSYKENVQFIHGRFLTIIGDLHIEENFENLNIKIKNYQGVKDEENKLNQSKLDKIISDYNQIRKEAREMHLYSYNLLENLEKEYNRKNDENINDLYAIYDNLCKNIINYNIQYYIKYEKKLIIIVDNFNKIYSFYIYIFFP